MQIDYIDVTGSETRIPDDSFQANRDNHFSGKLCIPFTFTNITQNVIFEKAK